MSSQPTSITTIRLAGDLIAETLQHLAALDEAVKEARGARVAVVEAHRHRLRLQYCAIIELAALPAAGSA